MLKRLLVIDDQQDILDNFYEEFCDSFIVMTAKGENEAFVFQDKKFDVVICDIHLWNGDDKGIIFIEQYRKKFPDAFTVLISGDTSQEKKARDTAHVFFDKIIRPAEMKRRILNLIRKMPEDMSDIYAMLLEDRERIEKQGKKLGTLENNDVLRYNSLIGIEKELKEFHGLKKSITDFIDKHKYAVLKIIIAVMSVGASFVGIIIFQLNDTNKKLLELMQHINTQCEHLRESDSEIKDMIYSHGHKQSKIQLTKKAQSTPQTLTP